MHQLIALASRRHLVPTRVVVVSSLVALVIAGVAGTGRASRAAPLPKSVQRSELAYAVIGTEGLPNGVVTRRVGGAKPVRVLAKGPQQYAALDWSPDGARLAFNADQDKPGDFDIYIVGADESGITDLTPLTPGNDAEPAFSPDGSLIAFTSNRVDPTVFDLYVMRADGSDQRQITQGLSVTSPDWAPDGSRIVYTASPPDARLDTDVWTIAPDGTDARVLVGGAGVQSFGIWSPDGRRIAYVDESGGPAQLRTVAPDGRGSRRVSPTSLSATFPDWAPDSRRLAFRGARADTADDIFTVDVDGKDVKNLSRTIDNAERIAKWSPDGKGIAFTSTFNGQESILVVDSHTGKGLTLLGGDTTRAFFPAWRPNPPSGPAPPK